MAYALIAGLSPIYGLYASLVPLVVYAFFGTSQQLAVGPVAMVSLLVAAAVAPFADGNTDLYIGLSHPVLSGFTSAAALIIALTLLFLTPLFYYLPKAVLAAIVMVAVFGLIDWEEARYLWRMDRRDFGLMALTVVAALSLDIEQEETASKEPVSTPS